MIKKRLEHAVFLMGMLFIALVTSSANAFAEEYTITVTDNSNITVSPEKTDADGTLTSTNNVITLSLTNVGTHKLPTTKDEVTMAINGNSFTDFTYTAGAITLNNPTIEGDIVITAIAIAKSTDATLNALKYTVSGGGSETSVTNFASGTETYNETLPYDKSINGKTITINATKTNEFATVVINSGSPITIADSKATATIVVTPENGTPKTYTVNFTVALPKITDVTVPTAKTLTKSYNSFNEVEADLDKTMVITAEDGTTSLPLTWTVESGNYNAASGATNTCVWTATVPQTLNVNNQQVRGEVVITNFTTPKSTDNKLSALTYQVPSGAAEPVTGFAAGDTGNKEYSVELPSSTSATANITVAATAAVGATFKVAGVAATSPFTVTLVNGAKDFVLNVIAEDGTTERTVTIKFTTAKSTDNKLTALTYKIGSNTATSVTGFNSADTGDKTYTVNTIPFGTATVEVTATAATGGTVKNEANTSPFTVTLKGTTVVPLGLTVTSESGVDRTVTINFSAVKDKITSVTPPVAPTLTEKLNEAGVIALLPKKATIITEGKSETELPLSWTIKSGKTFTDVSGSINTFTWTATAPESLDVNGKSLTGDIDVANALVPETGSKGDISVSAPAYQLGDGSTSTTAGTVTVSSTVKEITFNKATVTTNVVIQPLTNLTITLKGTGNDIAKITNAGTLILKNASTAKSAPSIATKAVGNTGAVKVIENSGTFTDETGTIVAVTGTNGLEITTLPTNQLNVTATTAQLTVAATSGATFQWKKNGSNVATNGTSATLTVDKANAGSYTCVVKNASTVTLMTPPVTVSFKETTPPPTPTFYVVSLPAVTGATFSKGERTSVNEGDNFVFMITLDKDYNLSVPVVKTSRNEDIVPVAGVYTVKNVKEDLTVTVTGIIKNVPTGIDDVNNGTRIWASGNTLHIYTEKTEDVYVFNASGILQKQFRTPGGDYTTQMNEGLYIVKIGGYTQKVIIK